MLGGGNLFHGVSKNNHEYFEAFVHDVSLVIKGLHSEVKLSETNSASITHHLCDLRYMAPPTASLSSSIRCRSCYVTHWVAGMITFLTQCDSEC